MNLRTRLTIFLGIVSLSLAAQTSIPDTTSYSLKDVVGVAMELNQDILVARNNIRIAENNAGILNSGYLPSLTGSGSGSYSSTNTNMTYSSGDKVSRDGAVSKAYSGSVGLNYRLFDGFNRYFNYQVLQANLDRSSLQARSIIENTLLSLINAYYDVARLTAKRENILRTLQISQTRYQYVRDRFNYGQSTELDVLNAEVDLNNDSVNLINTRREFQLAKNNLLLLMGVEIDQNAFEVDTLVVFNPVVPKDSLWSMAVTNNADYLISIVDEEVSDLSLKQSRSGYYPSLDVNGNYSVNKTDNEVGFLLNQQNSGFSTGLTLSWNIFDSGKTRTRELNARISRENATFSREQSKLSLQQQFGNAFTNYKDLVYIMNVEERNMGTSRMNFQRSVEQFRLGQISSLDFRTAQVELQNAIDRYNTAMYNAKVAEMQLLKLAGLFLQMI